MGWTFWVGCGWFFFGSLVGGGRGWGRVNVRSRTSGSFSLDDTRFQIDPFFYVICYILSSGGFTASFFKTIGNGVVEPRYPGQTRVC